MEKEAPPPYSGQPVPPPTQPQPGAPPAGQPVYYYAPGPPGAPVYQYPPQQEAPKKDYCGFSRKCCFVTWGIVAAIVAILTIVWIVLVVVFFAKVAPSDNFECTVKSKEKVNSAKAVEWYSCDLGMKECRLNMTKVMCQAGQVCEIKKDAESPYYTVAGCGSDMWVGCHYKKKARSKVGGGHKGELICRCDTPNCNTWHKCGCKDKFFDDGIVLCGGRVLKFNWILLVVLSAFFCTRHLHHSVRSTL